MTAIMIIVVLVKIVNHPKPEIILDHSIWFNLLYSVKPVADSSATPNGSAIVLFVINN